MNQMNDLIEQEEDPRRIEILRELKKCNWEAKKHMKQAGKSWKIKYRAMWKQDFWRRAKDLLREYFEKEGTLRCAICKRRIYRKFTLHHEDDYYQISAFFNPRVVQLIHHGCHYKHHFQGGNKK